MPGSLAQKDDALLAEKLFFVKKQRLPVERGSIPDRPNRQCNIKQQEIADLIGMHRSNYSKIESGQREISLNALEKIARFFGVTLDELVYMDGELPQEVEIEDKTAMEQLQLMQELDEDERSMIFKMIDSFLTKKKFKDFFNKNVSTL
jgi:transcriptional regulator with XRE-family HTH domain